MIINQWRNGAMRITRSEDDFYCAPLPQMTMFHFASHDVVVDPHEGAFSIKFVLSGSEDYCFPRRRAIVSKRRFI